MPVLRGLTLKTPKRRSSMRWPRPIACFKDSKTVSTACSALVRLMFVVVTITVGKSTYARCGIITNVTPFEPEWEGFVTLEISNTTPLPAKIYANEGIAQILFLRAEEVCQTSYADKKGKYQDQKGLTLPFVVGANHRE